MKRTRLWLLLAALLLCATLPNLAQAADITVDESTCHLADAIAAANSNADTGGCIGSGTYGDDTIILQTDVTLVAALPEITNTVTIEGGGHFISGNNDLSVGSVLRVASSGNLTLNEAIVKNGKKTGNGGGIYNSGTFTLTNSTVSGNTAYSYSECSSYSSSKSSGGGIYNEGAVTLTNSTVSGNIAYSYSCRSSSISEGGGCYNEGAVMLTNSTVSGNTASSSGSSSSEGGGIYSLSGAVTLMNSTVSGNTASSPSYFLSSLSGGGGISSYSGTVTLTNSIVSGNTASSYGSYGGGISNYFSTVTLTNSTVSGNTASSVSSRGGGIRNGSGTVTLMNSTVSGNTSSSSSCRSYGGGICNYGTVTLTNSTVSGNTAFSSSYNYSYGGGIYNNDTVTLHRSIISGNTASTGKEVYNAAILNADSYNLFGHSGETNAQAFYGFTPSGSDVNSASDGGTPTALSAILNTALADNGGPTQTHALPAGSPAIDLDGTCNGGTITTDQRGYDRPVNSSCDAGAFEFGGVPTGVDDIDDDFLPDLIDNCPYIYNPEQEDGVGDVCCEPANATGGSNLAPVYKLLLKGK